MPKPQIFTIDTLVTLAKQWGLPATDEATFYSALFAAVKADNLERVQQALAAGVSPNHLDKEGCTLLIVAAIFGSKKVIEHLLNEYDIAPDIIPEKAVTSPLHAAVQANKVEVVLQFALYAQKKNRRLDTHVSDAYGETPLLSALRFFNGDVAKWLVEKNLANPADSYKPETRKHIQNFNLNSLGMVIEILCGKAAQNQQKSDATKIGELEDYAEYVIDKRKMNLFVKGDGVRAPVEYLQDYRHPDAKTADEHLQKALVCIQNRSPKMYLRLLAQANDVPASSPLASFATRIKVVASKIETVATTIGIAGPGM